MKLTTLCYLEREGCYLMLHRVSKKNDVNKDKWIGVGGKFEPGESPEDCLLREVYEETGYRLTDYALRGIVTFLFNEDEAEYMFLYTAAGFEGTPALCDEGVLEWVPKEEIDRLYLWEGDRIFFQLLKDEAPFFSLKLRYEDDRLAEAALDGRPMELLDVLDETGEPSGLVRERTLVHLRGDYHRTVHIWLARKREDGGYDLLLQKRSGGKDTFPGCYDTSSAGHVRAGGGFLESALRELSEELGIQAKAEELCFLGYREDVYQEGRFRNHERSAVYLYTGPAGIGDLTLQADEVESVRWMDLSEILTRVRQGDPGFCLFEDELLLLRSCLSGIFLAERPFNAPVVWQVEQPPLRVIEIRRRERASVGFSIRTGMSVGWSQEMVRCRQYPGLETVVAQPCRISRKGISTMEPPSFVHAYAPRRLCRRSAQRQHAQQRQYGESFHDSRIIPQPDCLRGGYPATTSLQKC